MQFKADGESLVGFKGVSVSARRILWSRFLTHSGDQAWDFALPLALVGIVPGGIGTVALFYLIVRTGHLFLVSKVCGLLDRWNRLVAIRVGIGAQTLGVVAALIAINGLASNRTDAHLFDLSATSAFFILALMAGILSSLGATLMEVAVSQDWIPTVVPLNELAHVNSHLKQIDLFTELSAPIVAGLLLAVPSMGGQLFGVCAIAAWNLVSFFPEYRLLRSVHQSETRLDKGAVAQVKERSILARLAAGWREFSKQPAALSMAAYSLLWLTILSPHGVLLTAWLKSEWKLPEVAVGIFRGLGAVFGLLATVLFPLVLKRFSLVSASRIFILWQAACLIGVGIAFAEGREAVWIFVALILLSRIGLYGFSLGETEIRQISIADGSRGRINGFAQALTSLATIGVYAGGTYYADAGGFAVLVYLSIGFVVFAAILFTAWSLSPAAASARL
jgi:iron-regulated transporter 1